MNVISPKTRRRNLVTFILLVVFAAALCVTILLSMRVHARREGRNTDPTLRPGTSWQQSRLSFAA